MRKLPYLQGLRGAAALVVVLHHYFCAFYPVAIFGSGKAHSRWENLLWSTPLSVFVSGGSAVALFFILSGFVLSFPYFGPGAKDSSQLCAAMVKRPFRLVGLVALTMTASMLLLCGHFYHDHDLQVETSLGSEWIKTQNTASVSALRFIRDLICDSFWTGEKYNQPLWTISFELAGSYLTYIFALLFRNSQLRWWAYGILAMTFFDSLYCGFVLGIFLADLSKNFQSLLSKGKPYWVMLPLLVVGIYFASYPQLIDRSQLPLTWFSRLPWFHFSYHYSIAGAFLFFYAVLASPLLQRLFSITSVVYLGRISFALYTIHLLVLRSFSLWIFLTLSPYFSYNQTFVCVVCCSALVIVTFAHLVTVYFDEIVIRLSDHLAAFWVRSNASKAP